MHANDNARSNEAENSRPPARTPPGRVATPLPALSALQSSVGNSAVVQMLRWAEHPSAQDRHEHSADCGHQQAEQPVQRSTVHDVLRTPGQRMDDATRTDMEARLGAGFSDVRIHNGTAAKASAAEVGARAYTSGNHVVLGEGGGDRHTLAHELTHVIQQRQGPVSGTDSGSGLSVSDPSDRFEREAEENATRALSSEPPAERPRKAGEGALAAPTVRRLTGAPGPAATSDGDTDLAPVQKAVTVRGDIYSDDPKKSYSPATQGKTPHDLTEDFMRKVTAAVEASKDDTLIGQFNANREKVSAQAKKWIADSRVGTPSKGNHKFGSKKHEHSYPDFEQAGRALVGWVLQKPGRHEEKVFANDLMNDPEFATDLDSVLGKVKTWIRHIGDDKEKLHDRTITVDISKIIEQLTTGKGDSVSGGPDSFGTYQRYFDKPGSGHQTKFQGNFMAVLDNPAQFDVRDKVIVLHDVYDYFKPRNETRKDPETAGQGVLPRDPDDKMLESSQEMKRDGTRKVSGPDRGSVLHGTTRNETAQSTRMAREHRIPVSAGQSFTTGRLLHLGREVDATPEELSAMALGIFAFWRIDYDHTVELAAHTLHEVLDIAANFGVPYNMKVPQRGSRRYQQLMANRAKRTNDKLQQQIEPLRGAVKELQRDIESRERVGRFLNSRRQGKADKTLKEYEEAVDTCKTLRAKAEKASEQQEKSLSAEYSEALREALTLYEELCRLVKSKRVEDTLNEDDRDAVGGSRIPKEAV
ncbi:DUF4157 domain-containing protein [Streptomyces sp. NPDC026589]|uniref:eCIS core domain-containing protein n=1 Tax=Streptomyces sp. NPDC026589 TaxID=3155609 RepID=UPI0033F8C3E3